MSEDLTKDQKAMAAETARYERQERDKEWERLYGKPDKSLALSAKTGVLRREAAATELQQLEDLMEALWAHFEAQEEPPFGPAIRAGLDHRGLKVVNLLLMRRMARLKSDTQYNVTGWVSGSVTQNLHQLLRAQGAAQLAYTNGQKLDMMQHLLRAFHLAGSLLVQTATKKGLDTDHMTLAEVDMPTLEEILARSPQK